MGTAKTFSAERCPKSNPSSPQRTSQPTFLGFICLPPESAFLDSLTSAIEQTQPVTAIALTSSCGRNSFPPVQSGGSTISRTENNRTVHRMSVVQRELPLRASSHVLANNPRQEPQLAEVARFDSGFPCTINEARRESGHGF